MQPVPGSRACSKERTAYLHPQLTAAVSITTLLYGGTTSFGLVRPKSSDTYSVPNSPSMLPSRSLMEHAWHSESKRRQPSTTPGYSRHARNIRWLRIGACGAGESLRNWKNSDVHLGRDRSPSQAARQQPPAAPQRHRKPGHEEARSASRLSTLLTTSNGVTGNETCHSASFAHGTWR